MEQITEKVKYFLEKYNLLDSEQPILIAFSGGYDSMCLLDVLVNLSLKPIAIHLNHNWRGDESRLEEEACRKFCESKGIQFYKKELSKDIPHTETVARDARYEFFENCAKRFNSKAVLTAHNANDNAETLIYRIAKGTGTTGLIGISEKRGIFYRPILNIKRNEIEKYCLEHNLTPNNDSSNRNTKYKRNHIRANILPELEKINSDAIDKINQLSEIAQLDNEIIEEYIKKLEKPYCTKNFINFSKAVQLRLVYNLFIENNLDYDNKKIQNVLDFILENSTSKSGKTKSLTKNLWIFVSENNIEIITKNIHSKEEITIDLSNNNEYKISDYVFKIEKFTEQKFKFPKDSEFKAIVDLSKYDSLTLRHRKDGDVISPLGCEGSQKLKKYLNEKKIPAHQKEEMVFIADKDEILWVAGFGISEKIKVITQPTHIVKIEKREI